MGKPCRSACKRSGILGSASGCIVKAFGKSAGASGKTGKHCAKRPSEGIKKEDAVLTSSTFTKISFFYRLAKWLSGATFDRM